MRNVLGSALLPLFALTVSAIAGQAHAQEVSTTGEALSVPVFDSVDENSVDLITGMLRIKSPLLTMGSGDEQVTFGFEWTGRSWRILGMPMVNRLDNGHYAVTYNEVTEEFDTRSNGFAQRKPVTGSTLDCRIWGSNNLAGDCMYVNRYGDVVEFKGRTDLGPYPSNYGMTVLALGNLGLHYVEVTSARHPVIVETNSQGQNVLRRYTFGENLGPGPGFDSSYNGLNRYILFGNQELKITTPNQDGTDTNEHYLRPKSTTQTFTDDFGAVWSYTVNGSREITYFQPPDGLAGVSYTYNGDHRVTSVTNAAGTWNYQYSSNNGYRTITVSTPTGRIYSVKSHIDNGYVVEHTEGLAEGSPRVTRYDFDSGQRLQWVTYPELNSMEFVYDGRGNARFKRVYPKPGSTEPMLEWQAGYWQADYSATCSERVLCNRMTYLIDPEGNRTDFEYAPPGTTTVTRYLGQTATQHTVAYGHGQPVVIRQPGAYPGGPRPTTTNTYVFGRLATSSTCTTQETCAGTADEVKTEHGRWGVTYSADFKRRNTTYELATIMAGIAFVPSSTAVVSNGVKHLACTEIDANGRAVSETPPSGGLTSCSSGLVAAPAYNASVPESGEVRATPTFSQ